MGFLANLLVKIGVDTADLNAGMDKATRSVNKFATDVTDAGRRLSVGISLPLIGVGAAAVKAAGDMEQTKVAFTTLLKSADAAKAHLEELKRFALTTPFQFEDLTKASRLMQAYGFAAADVVPKLRTMGNAVAALGGGNQLLERVVRSMGEIGTRGKITGEQLRELSRAGIPALDAVAKKLGVTVAEAQKQVTAGTVDAQTAMDALLGYMESRFQGGMEAQSKTFLGTWSNIKDKLTFTLVDIGNTLLPVGKNLMTNVLDPMLASVQGLAAGFAKLSPTMQATILASAGLAAALPLLTIAIGATITNAIAIGNAFSKMIPVVVALSNTIAGLGSKSFGLLVTSFTNVGAGYAAMLATGILRVSVWAALAYEIYQVVGAFNAMRDAQAGAEKATKEQQDSLLRLETSLKRQGANITELQKQYAQGQLTWTQYMQKLRDVAIQLGQNISAEQKHAVAIVDIDKMLTDSGLKTMAQRKKDLEQAKALYAAVVKEYGAGSVIAADALKKLNDAQADLVPTAAKVKEQISGIPFGQKGLEAALLLEKVRLLAEEQREYVKEVAKVGGPAAHFQRAADQVAKAIDTLNKAPKPELMERMSGALEDALNPAMKLPPELQRTADALDAFGLSGKKADIEGLQRKFEDLGDGLANKTVTVEQHTRAYIALVKAMDAAGVALSTEERKRVIELEKQYGGQIKETRKEQSEFAREVKRTFDATARGIANSIVEWKGLGSTMLGIVKDLGKGVIEILVKGAFVDLGKAIFKVKTDAKGLIDSIKGIFGAGSSAASSAASAANSAGNAGAGAASTATSSVMSTIGAIGSVVSAVSGVIGNFQFAGMNKSLDLIVNHTLRIFNELFQFRIDAWTREGHLMLKLDDMWNEIRNVVAAVKVGGVSPSSSGKSGLTVNFYGPVNGDANQIAAAIFQQASLAGAL